MSISNTACVPSIMKGITAAPAILSTPNLDQVSRCARHLAGPLNTPPPHPTFLLSHTLRGRHLIYLIGQQRSQSSPHSVSKSSGNRTPVAANLFRLSFTTIFSARASKHSLNSASRPAHFWWPSLLSVY